MNKIQNVLNDEESMKQIKEFADMLTADNVGQGEQGGQSEAPQSPQNMDFSQLLLKEENQVKIDRLIKIFKLFAVYPALKESGLLGGDLLGLF